MIREIRFTKQAIDALQPAQAGERDYYADPRLPSLRVSVTATGAKSWVVQRRIQGKVTRVTLGRYPDLTPENARKLADQLVGQIAMGANPQAEKREVRASRLTLNDAFEEFLRIRHLLKPNTVRVYRQLISVGLGDWLSKPLKEITKDAVAERHAKLTRENGGPYANGTMRVLRAVWNFAQGQYEDSQGNSFLPGNPVHRLSKTKAWNRVKPKQTYIKEHELPAWFAEVQKLRAEPRGSMAQTVGDYLMVLLLTGMRRSEAARLTWDQVDLKDRVLRLVDTKNHEDHSLPISVFLYEILKGRAEVLTDSRDFPEEKLRSTPNLTKSFVFPSENLTGPIQEPRYQKQKVTQATGIEFTLHDLRRTFITVAERLGLGVYVLSRLANHQMGHPVTRDYIITDIERLRAPMQQVTDYFLSAAGVKRKAQVVSLQKHSKAGKGS